MTHLLPKGLSRRERQIMQILYERGQASAAEVQGAIPDPPGYSAIRRHLAILEEKGRLRHEEHEGRYIFFPTQSWKAESKSAIEQVVDAFFGGRVEQAVATLLTSQRCRPDQEELQRLEAMIQQARAEEMEEDEHTIR